MTYKIAVMPRPIQMVCLIGVGEGVQRDSRSRLGEQAANTRHFANKYGIPPIKKLRARDVNSEGHSIENGSLSRRNNGVDIQSPSGSNELAFRIQVGASTKGKPATGGSWAARGKRRVCGASSGE